MLSIAAIRSICTKIRELPAFTERDPRRLSKEECYLSLFVALKILRLIWVPSKRE
jgi:hypothetical protein